MEKRYQVFVSSTFEDLREERSAIISALLRLDCIPAGMELFPASDEDSWTLIKNVIDDCDYYLVIVAGRYGSLSPSGKSYTEAEYEYAISIGKPTVALLHSNPQSLAFDKSEASEDLRARLEVFRDQLKKKNVRHWKDRGDLITEVMTALLHLKKTRPAAGWVKGSGLPSIEYQEEILRLRRKVDSLEEQLKAEEAIAPPDNEQFAQDSDETRMTATIDWVTADGLEKRRDLTVELQWKEIFSAVLPFIYGGGTINDIAKGVVGLVREKAIKKQMVPHDWVEKGTALTAPSGAKVVNQMLALGLISGIPHPRHPTQTVWQATAYGRRTGARLIAERRDLRSGTSA